MEHRGEATTTTRSESEPSARDWLRRLEARECSARELVERCLTRIEAVNGDLNAAVALDGERSLAEAEEADRARAAGDASPLLGLPLTVKDSLDAAGWPTRAGSFARQGFVADADASAVGRLRAAGAVLVAKTNAPECSSSYETDNAIFGRTNNPLDLERTPGGSSGGEAALLGVDASIVGVGADGGGSIRFPSHCCGIVGLRPTVGRVPETGVWPPTRPTGMLDLLCVGPMARFVEDLELLLPLMSGADGVDPFAPAVPAPELPAERRAPSRAAVYVDDPLNDPTPATREAVRAAAAALADAGCEVEEVDPPEAGEATALFFAAVGGDGGAHLKEAVGPAGGRHHPQFQALLDGLPETPPPATELLAVLRRLFELRARVRAFAGAYDVVLCPVASGPAPRHGKPPAGIPDDEYMRYEGFNYVHTYAVAGLPALSVPAGREEGLPLGVQVVAAPFREDLVLGAGRIIEASLGGLRPDPEIEPGGSGE